MTKVTKANQVLGRLRMARGDWVHFRALNNICFRYGARIYDLRQKGHDIQKHQMHGVWYYRLEPGSEEIHVP